MCWCVCVCWCVFVRADSLRSVPQQLHQAQRMFGGIGNVLLSRPVLKLKMGKIHWFSCGETSEARDDHTWPNFGKQH